MSRCLNNKCRWKFQCGRIFTALLTLSLSLQSWSAGESQLSKEGADRASKCAELLSAKKSEPGRELVQFDKETFAFQGLTPEGLEALKKARDTIRERVRLFDGEIRNLGSLHHAGMVARLFKGNMFLYGPPGGAKSMFVKWLMRGEAESPYQLQLHQMITEQAFTGGQNFEAAKRGEFEINTKGSLADKTVALIDETEKGNPAALSALLSLLNEREVLAGNQVVRARLETLFATSNANLPEIFQQFLENGQGSTAPALLNRFQFKAFVYNWLSSRDQAILDRRRQRREYLEALAESNPEAKEQIRRDEVFLEPGELDWQELRVLAKTLFKPNELFMTKYREFVNDMREQTNIAIRNSEDRHQQKHQNEPFVYFPSADYTERLRQQVPEIVVISAFIDFLMSPLSTDAMLERLSTKQIELDPLSLWRAYLVLTTLGPGETRLVFDPDSENKVDIDFDFDIDPKKARDRREELLILNLKAEQERFERTYMEHISGLRGEIELRARNGLNSTDGLENTSFEIMMMSLSGE